MKASSSTYANLEDARNAAEDFCLQAKQDNKRPVLLCDSPSRTLEERRTLAARNAGFGVEVATLPKWAEALWALFGDGRTPITHVQRIALAAALIHAQDELPKTPGMVNLLATAARESLIYRTRPAPLMGQEKIFVKLLEQYAERLQAHGLCEYCEMLEHLCSQPLESHYLSCAFDADSSSFCAAEHAFLNHLDTLFIQVELQASPSETRTAELQQLLSILFQRSENDSAIPATGSLVCALSAGPTATSRLVANCLEHALNNNPTEIDLHICVASKHPDKLFNYCAPLLTKQGLSAELFSATTFAQTHAGRAVLACLSIAEQAKEEQLGNQLNFDKLQAADYSFNPFAGIWYTTAFQNDQTHRGNRLLGADQIINNLSHTAKEQLQDVLPFFQQERYLAALSIMETFAENAFAAQPLYKTEQLRALSIAREAFTNAQQTGAPVQLVLESMATKPLAVHALAPLQQLGTVRFTTLHEASMLPAASIDALIVCDLDVNSYPVRTQENAYTTLLKKWGTAMPDSPLADQHKMFFNAVAASRYRVYLQRSLNTYEANPLQPAVLFEEVMDCYRLEVANFNDTNKQLGIPDALAPFAMQAGEESLVRNATSTLSEKNQQLTWPNSAEISTHAKELLVLPRAYNGTTYPGADLSASQIESYLECPYQWFVKRRLSVEGIGEGFSAPERGSFVHNVLCAFYEAFRETIAPKVTPENLPQAKILLERVFNEQRARDLQRSPGRRYVPISAWEEQLLADLLLQLQDSLAYEAAFLPSFHPLELEWTFGSENPFSYAGCNLAGTIDRIDVDEKGNAVVIDYKTGNLDDYCLLSSATQEEFVLPHKMQALIYAKVVRDLLKLNVVGALYYNPFKGVVRGAYANATLGPADVLGISESIAQRCSVPCIGIKNFDTLINTCETMVEQKVCELLAGEIEPRPLANNVCKYCPVGVCSKRIVAGEW